MQPEVLCGVDVEEVQRKTAEYIQDAAQESSEVLNQLVSLPFDAILKTNYTYEIESAMAVLHGQMPVAEKVFYRWMENRMFVIIHAYATW